MAPVQAAPNWALKTLNVLGTERPYGLMFGETESVLYSLGIQNSQVVLSRLDSSTGTV
jgi:hypothetical protein